MHNVKYEKRVYPNDSFIIACGLSLNDYSGTRYRNIRKIMPFQLFTHKRILFTVLSRTNNPLDSMLSTHLHSAHSHILSKIAKWLKHKLETHDDNGAPCHPMIVIDFHLEKCAFWKGTLIPINRINSGRQKMTLMS